MENKFKISNIDKQFMIIIYSVFVLYGCMFASKSYSFPQYNRFIFFGIYVIIGFALPILINLKNIKKPVNKFDKNLFAFSIYFSVGFSMILESVIYYIFSDSFLSITQNSWATSMEFSLPLNVLVILAFCIIMVVYFTSILNVLLTEFAPIYCILVTAIAFAMMFHGNMVKNLVLGLMFSMFIVQFSHMKIPIILLFSSTASNVLFEYIYGKYFPFGLMHYYNFIFVIIGFFLIMKSLKSMEKIMFYYKFKSVKLISIKQREMKIVWFAVLLIGIFIATYNGRF